MRDSIYTQGSDEEADRPMFLRVLVSFSNQCLGTSYIPYYFFLSIHNSPDWLNGELMGGFMILVSLSGKVALQKYFFSCLV